MTSHDREFMNRIVNKIIEIDGGALTSYSGDYEFYQQQRALAEKQQQAQFERQQAMLAKEINFIERFKARASHAAQVQSRVKKLDKIERVEPPRRRQTVSFEFQPAPRSGEDVVSSRTSTRPMAAAASMRGWTSRSAQGALVRDGRQRRRQVDAAEAGHRRDRARHRHVNIGGSVKLGYFAQHAMEVLEGERTVFQTLEDRSRRPGRARCARSPAASASPATMSRSAAGCCQAARRRGW
jgi:ATPase subunit of ABC transporter with duplicated ATPase domains